MLSSLCPHQEVPLLRFPFSPLPIVPLLPNIQDILSGFWWEANPPLFTEIGLDTCFPTFLTTVAGMSH